MLENEFCFQVVVCHSWAKHESFIFEWCSWEFGDLFEARSPVTISRPQSLPNVSQNECLTLVLKSPQWDLSNESKYVWIWVFLEIDRIDLSSLRLDQPQFWGILKTLHQGSIFLITRSASLLMYALRAIYWYKFRPFLWKFCLTSKWPDGKVIKKVKKWKFLNSFW